MGGRVLLLIFSLINLVSKCTSIEVEQQNNHREGKVFSLFNIVKFENDACQSTLTTTTGANRNGTCFTSSECGDKSGTSKGSCAAGFGTCCVFILDDSTSKTVSQNNTYVQNPAYPSVYADSTDLTYTVNKCNSEVCYLRIDFEEFTILGPSNSLEWDDATVLFADAEKSGGKCQLDTFDITAASGGGSFPQICGQNTGQHVYVSLGTASSDSATLAFGFTGDSTSRKWDMKISQIECGSIDAPTDPSCLQYYTGLSGTIKTFNFLDTSTTHLGSQDYSVCFRKEQGYCCIQYTECTAETGPFSLYVSETGTVDAQVSQKEGATSCTEDYITIAGGQGVCSTNPALGGVIRERYCGYYLNVLINVKISAPVCACASPFAIGIKTDDTTDPHDSTTPANAIISRGVCLDFQQQPC